MGIYNGFSELGVEISGIFAIIPISFCCCGRIFVMPSRLCLNSVHNTRGIINQSDATSNKRFGFLLTTYFYVIIYLPVSFCFPEIVLELKLTNSMFWQWQVGNKFMCDGIFV